MQGRPIHIESNRDWFKHHSWVLAPDHIRNLMQDGLSERTIKMSGAYTVFDEFEKSNIISRYGRSPRKSREYLGRLLVFPNPLIWFEQHSRTDIDKPKYIAPDNSCSPPMPIPVQACVTPYNQKYLEELNGKEEFQIRVDRLSAAKEAEKRIDIEGYSEILEKAGFDKARAALIAEQVFTASTSSRLYNAMADTQAEIEITEGQKKAYKMFQSYKELLAVQDVNFLKGLDPSMPNDAIAAKIQGAGLASKPNKLFLCSPGVWQPIKAWKNIHREEKLQILEAVGTTGASAGKSPLNPNNKYCMIPSWMFMIDWTSRKVIITYDQDAGQNINVAHSITSLAQSITDVAPNAEIYYRLIEEINGKKAKGADDFLVAHGNSVFWEQLKLVSITPNVSWKEISDFKGNYILSLSKQRYQAKT